MLTSNHVRLQFWKALGDTVPTPLFFGTDKHSLSDVEKSSFQIGPGHGGVAFLCYATYGEHRPVSELLPTVHLSEKDDERPPEVGGRENLHDSAKAIQSAHDSEHFFGHAGLLGRDSVPIAHHGNDVRETDRNVWAPTGTKYCNRIKHTSTATWAG